MSDTAPTITSLPLAKKRRLTKKRIFGTLALVATTAAVTSKIARSGAASNEPERPLDEVWTGNTTI